MMTRNPIQSGTTILAAAVFATSPVFAEPSGHGTDLAVRPGESIALDVGESTVIRASWPAKRISISDPKVADIEVLAPDRILVSARSVGATDLVMWNQDDEVQQTQVKVDVDLGQLSADLSDLFPTAALKLKRSKHVIAIQGSLSRAEEADQLHRFLDATGITFVDMTSLAGIQQVEIQVRVAEASRNALRELGIDTLIRGSTEHGLGQFFPLVGEDFGIGTIGPETGLLSLQAGWAHADLEILLEALAENQYLQILAEPNLTALSGEEASFLAGGEFPVPVVQGGLGGNSNSVTVEYKEFGIRLAFRPIVLGNGKIRLQVATEVSDITDVGSVESQGFRIPAIITRRAQTTVQMGSGQTFGMAGLISQDTEAINSRLPGLGDLPVLGPLFRSVSYARGETELLVLVRASLVEPLSIASDIPLPGDMHAPPTDVELFGEGRLERKPSHDIEAPDAAWRQALGLDSLKGPDAWSRYGSPVARSRATLKVRKVSAPEPLNQTEEVGESEDTTSGN